MHNELTLPQAAVRISRSYRAAQKLMFRGQLGPVRQVAGRWLISEAGVDAFLERSAGTNAAGVSRSAA